jgi:hypothetical protein
LPALMHVMQSRLNYSSGFTQIWLQMVMFIVEKGIQSMKPQFFGVSSSGSENSSLSIHRKLSSNGHFKSSTHEMEIAEYRSLPLSYGILNPSRNFIARATGNSMNAGKSPIKDGDYLLLDLITPESAGSISNQLVVIEKHDESGDDQYLLRYIKKNGPGDYTLKAWNENYPDMPAGEDMITIARVKSVIDPLDLIIHTEIKREDIPPLFSLEFNQGLWQSGHVCPKNSSDQFLLVTLNKQGQQAEHRYHDYFINDRIFHWQSQNSTSPLSKKGRGIIEQAKVDSKIHLFVRMNKLVASKGAPFYYCGTVKYLSHSGSNPISVKFSLNNPLSDDLIQGFGLQSD